MSLAPSDVVVGWQQLAQINMKAREQQVSSNQELTTATTNHISIANLPTVGYNSSNVATTKRTRANNSDVIIVSDEDSPSPDGQQQPANELHALRELLHQEEKKLSMLKTIRGLQSTTVATNGNSTGKIQGSALNKTTGRSSPNITLSRRDISGSGGTRAIQPKHSIVVVPGNHQLNATPSTASMSSGISSRLQQLVDTIAVDQALNSSQIKSTRNLKANSVTTWSQQGRQVSTTPPVPGLTSISPTPAIKPPSISLINDTLLNLTSSSIPPLRPKLTSSVHRPAHEIITISDSPGSKNPPPLLSTNVGPITVPTATARGLIQIPTISSTSGSKMLRELALSKPTSEKEMRESIESSRRYREYVIKQSTAKKNFQKQMDRKMLLAPYPKTFRQVWPVIPVHDPAFISNFGLEEVTHFFESNLKGPQDRTNTTAKVKPICNQCGCDFASAWQIRKSNSKQLLLCESCDFQNLKILQRQKLANQLKDLLDSIKKEEEKFSSECEEAKKQVVALEKQSYERLPTANSSVTRNPPPLTSQLHGTQPTKHSTFTPTIVNGNQVTKHQFESVKSTSSNVTSKPTSTTVISIHPKAVIPSILGQTSVSKATDDVRSNSRKRKEPLVSATPPSKAYKPGSTLDVTLNKLSQQLINRKLNEKRQEAGQVPEDGHNKEEAVVDQSPPPPATAVIVNNGGSESRRNRRKGKPRHKRHLSASSATSE